MAFAIDAVLIFTAIFCIWTGARKGFVRSVMGVVTTAVSAVVSYAFTPALAAFIRDRFLIDRITAGIEEPLRSFTENKLTGFFNLDQVATELPDTFTAILERYHIDLGEIVERMRGVTEATGETVHGLAADIASPTARVLSSALAFLALFIGCVIVLSLLTALLDLLFRMPVLNKANVFLGVVFGVVEAVVFVLVLSIALSVLVRSLGAIDPNLFGDEVVENTVVCRFVLEHNPLQQLYEVLK